MTPENFHRAVDELCRRLDDMPIPRADRELAKAYLEAGEHFADLALRFRAFARSLARSRTDLERREEARMIAQRGGGRIAPAADAPTG